MKAKSQEQKRAAIEKAARPTHSGLIEARNLFEEGDIAPAFMLARNLFPVAVSVAERRLKDYRKGKRPRDTKATIVNLASTGLIDKELAQRLRRCDIAATSWGDATDAGMIIEEALALLEATESHGCRKRREQAFSKPKSRWGRLATAAAILLTLGGAS